MVIFLLIAESMRKIIITPRLWLKGKWLSPTVIVVSQVNWYTQKYVPVFRSNKQYWKYKKSNLCMMMLVVASEL